ncbi:O-succinylhomoserine sulfhydrylase [Caballeronia temeraria]|uniref:O-succinylhomoserine sulfhydrylase n=1 Tax=Caballeronia temeraria TaxID=1777137 RepID=A0A158ADI2_9BURK|nr:O-succinylhomoserine sulfhydrylase [Caballeronia temeraria]SAK55765.1 O-succinylhomoserine sulfhydrylase [Caballeronia temeraria]
MDDHLNFDTLAVRAGTLRSEFNEHAEALFLTSSFCFSSAAEAAERFRNAEDAYTYSRFTNPTVTMFQNRLASLEGGEACMATASGMSAILSVVMASMQQGDHIVSSKSLFGSTIGMFTQIFPKFGITTTFVDPTKPGEWQAAVTPDTKMFFLETPSNPLTEIADIEAIAKIAKHHGAIFVVDNCFCSPALQQPLKLGADVVMQVFPFVRSAGPTMSAFNAWVLLKGMETLALRVEKQSANALEIARWLEAHPAVNRVLYPGLASHPQHAIAKKQQQAGGAIVSFELKGETQEQQRANAWRVIDGTKLCSITGNLGDTRTTITHPSTTTHGRLTPEVREAAGIREGLIRLAVGLEDPSDIRADLARGLG